MRGGLDAEPRDAAKDLHSASVAVDGRRDAAMDVLSIGVRER